MISSTPLSEEQVQHFKTHGFLVLENLFDQSSLDHWREQIWCELEASLDQPDSWPRERTGLDGYQYDPPESALVHHSALTPIIQQLGGDDFVASGGAPIIRWPEPEKSWQMPQSGHIDAYGAASGWSPFMVGATTYLYDVQPSGGAFIFWPGSHHTAHRYFRQNPALVDGSFLTEEGFSWHTFSDNLCDNLQTGGQEFVARAGDVVLWHSYLTHDGSINANDCPRIALFARWPHQHQRQVAEFRYEVPEDLWKYWAI